MTTNNLRLELDLNDPTMPDKLKKWRLWRKHEAKISIEILRSGQVESTQVKNATIKSVRKLPRKNIIRIELTT
jgi:hypothetical protein